MAAACRALEGSSICTATSCKQSQELCLVSSLRPREGIYLTAVFQLTQRKQLLPKQPTSHSAELQPSFCFFFSLKCLLGIKPELSSTASVICNHKLTCDEKKLAKKRKKKIRKSNCLYSRCKEISLCSKMGEKQNATSCFPVTVYTTAAVSALLCKRCGYLSESNLHQMSSRNEQFRCVIGTKLCEQMNDSSVVHLKLADASCFSTLNFFVDLGFISLAG